MEHDKTVGLLNVDQFLKIVNSSSEEGVQEFDELTPTEIMDAKNQPMVDCYADLRENFSEFDLRVWEEKIKRALKPIDCTLEKVEMKFINESEANLDLIVSNFPSFKLVQYALIDCAVDINRSHIVGDKIIASITLHNDNKPNFMIL